MSNDDSPEAPLAPIELAGYHRVQIQRGDGVDTVELLGRDGKLVFAIEVSERGPVLRFEGPGLTLRAAGELAPLSEKLAPELPLEELVGASPDFRTALAVAAKAARNRLPILIIGEAGTGKETFARAIHAASLRARPTTLWPAGMPAQVLRVLQHADEVEAILSATSVDEPGGALSASAATARRDALRPIETAVRVARRAAVAEAVRVLAASPLV